MNSYYVWDGWSREWRLFPHICTTQLKYSNDLLLKLLQIYFNIAANVPLKDSEKYCKHKNNEGGFYHYEFVEGYTRSVGAATTLWRQICRN